MLLGIMLNKGSNILNGVINFSKTLHKAYESYALSVSRAVDVFEKEMLKYNTLDTTTICMSSFCSEMRNMIETMRNKCKQYDELLYNPSVMFNKHYVEQNLGCLEDADKFSSQVELSKKNVVKAKRRYFRRCQEKAA